MRDAVYARIEDVAYYLFVAVAIVLGSVGIAVACAILPSLVVFLAMFSSLSTPTIVIALAVSVWSVFGLWRHRRVILLGSVSLIGACVCLSAIAHWRISPDLSLLGATLLIGLVSFARERRCGCTPRPQQVRELQRQISPTPSLPEPSLPIARAFVRSMRFSATKPRQPLVGRRHRARLLDDEPQDLVFELGQRPG